MNCTKFRNYIESHRIEDIEIEKGTSIERHFKSCKDCSSLFNQHKILNSLALSLKEDIKSESLSDVIKNKVTSLAVSETKSGQFMPEFLHSKYSLAAALVTLSLVVMITLPFMTSLYEKPVSERSDFLLSEGHQAIKLSENSASTVGEQHLELEAAKVNGSVAFSWEAKGRKTYKITRSTSPKDFSNAYTVLVAGNKWVDPIQNSSNIVFYRIE